MIRSTLLFLVAVVGCGVGVVLDLAVHAWWASMFLVAELIVIVGYPAWRYFSRRRAQQRAHQLDADVRTFRASAAANGAYDARAEQDDDQMRCTYLPIDYALTDAALELNSLQEECAALEHAHLIVLRQLDDAHQRVEKAHSERDEANARATAGRLAP